MQIVWKNIYYACVYVRASEMGHESTLSIIEQPNMNSVND